MKIALLGYGKMGKEIESVALEKGHEISFMADLHNVDFQPEKVQNSDVAIEFSTPKTAADNILKCFAVHLPVVVGTTGWYDRFEEIKKKCKDENQSLFYATNFSIGVNIFFEINRRLAELMNTQPEYEISMEEVHHIHKLDAPSGTAITLAQDIIEKTNRKEEWTNESKSNPECIGIVSKRENEVPGTHTVKYDSEIDNISIRHEAKSRKGFATGAVMAAEWLVGKQGVYSMKDLLKI